MLLVAFSVFYSRILNAKLHAEKRRKDFDVGNFIVQVFAVVYVIEQLSSTTYVILAAVL